MASNDDASPLSYPSSSSAPSTSTLQPARPNAPTVHATRLFVGNLAPTVDEYTLLQVFAKYGKIAKLDFLFHKTGPLKGRPRGYAFVEFADKEGAAKALVGAHDRLVRGRKLSVTFANQAPPPHDLPNRAAARRPVNDAGKPTALSLLKAGGGRKASTDAKIAAMEAKLRQMQAAPAPPPHPSLPPRPFGPLPPADAPGAEKGQPMSAK